YFRGENTRVYAARSEAEPARRAMDALGERQQRVRYGLLQLRHRQQLRLYYADLRVSADAPQLLRQRRAAVEVAAPGRRPRGGGAQSLLSSRDAAGSDSGRGSARGDRARADHHAAPSRRRAARFAGGRRAEGGSAADGGRRARL